MERYVDAPHIEYQWSASQDRTVLYRKSANRGGYDRCLQNELKLRENKVQGNLYMRSYSTKDLYKRQNYQCR